MVIRFIWWVVLFVFISIASKAVRLGIERGRHLSCPTRGHNYAPLLFPLSIIVYLCRQHWYQQQEMQFGGLKFKTFMNIWMITPAIVAPTQTHSKVAAPLCSVLRKRGGWDTPLFFVLWFCFRTCKYTNRFCFVLFLSDYMYLLYNESPVIEFCRPLVLREILKVVLWLACLT